MVRVRCIELVNPARVKFASQSDGVVLDGRDDVSNTAGQMVVKDVTDVAMFAYWPSSPLLPNTAVLTGQSTAYTLQVAVVTDDDLLTAATRLVATPSCSTSASQTSFSLQGCTITLSASHSGSLSSASMEASYGHMSAPATFAVWAPSTIGLHVSQATLKRIADVDGVAIACPGGASMYQSAALRVSSDGLDVTPLVTFTVTDEAVAAIVQSVASSPYVTGLGAGTSTVHLAGGAAAAAFASVVVEDALALSSSLTARVVTSVDWHAQPSSTWDSVANIIAAATVKSELKAEGAHGQLFARITWDDGSSQPSLGSSNLASLNVTSLTTSVAVTPPAAGSNDLEASWRAEVAFGALAACLPRALLVEYRACGAVVAQGFAPLFLDLPAPTGLLLSVTLRPCRCNSP